MKLMSWSMGNRSAYHEEGCHNPVNEDAKADVLPGASVRKDAVQNLVLHFAEDWIHHDK
jgi:hypothetical protein